MYHFIVNMATGKRYRRPGEYTEAIYYTVPAAKGVITQLKKRKMFNGEKVTEPLDLKVMTYDEFITAFPVKMVTRTNLMSGLEFQEAEDTPNFCSPACEAYWSM